MAAIKCNGNRFAYLTYGITLWYMTDRQISEVPISMCLITENKKDISKFIMDNGTWLTAILNIKMVTTLMALFISHRNILAYYDGIACLF